MNVGAYDRSRTLQFDWQARFSIIFVPVLKLKNAVHSEIVDQ